MNEALFEQRLATRLGITPEEANTIVNAVKAEICESVKIYGKLTLNGVVTFETKAYGLTSGTTPHGELWTKESHTRVYTRSGKTLKAKVNEAPELPVNPDTPVVTDTP